MSAREIIVDSFAGGGAVSKGIDARRLERRAALRSLGGDP